MREQVHFTRSIPSHVFVAGTICFSLFFLLTTSLTAQLAGAGRTFTLCVPYLSPSTNGGGERIHLAFASDAGARVNLLYTATGRTEALIVPPNSSAELILDTADIPLPSLEGIFNRTIQVQATAPVTATVMLDRGTASEAYGAIADSLLGFEYLAVGYQSFGPGSFVVVAATEDETTITITPNIATLNGRPAGVPFTFMLHKGQVYQVLTTPRVQDTDDDDLTGTHVLADKPVAVWSGTTCSRLPVGNITCGPLLEQLPSIDMQGQRHPLAFYSGENQTFYNVIAPCAQTRIIAPDLLPAVDTVLSSPNRHRLGLTFQQGEIQTSTPALVAHLGVNISEQPPAYVDSAVGDPAMSIITPIEQMGTKHRFVIPSLFARSDGGLAVGWRYFVTVVRSSAAVQGTLDGQPIVFAGNVAVMPLFSGEHTVQADGPVSVTVNGRSVSDAFAMVPAPVVRTWPLWADSIAGGMCGDELDTVIQVFNRTAADITVDSVEFMVRLQGELVGQPLPFTVPANGRIAVRLRLRNLIANTSTGSIVFRSGSCHQRVLRIPVWLRPDRLESDPVAGVGRIDFPPVFPAGSSTQTITLRNPARYPVTVMRPTFTSNRFSVVSPAFPITIPPGSSEVVTLAFTSTVDDRVVDGQIMFHTLNCPEDSSFIFDLQGVVRRLHTIPPDPVRLLCEPKEPDTLVVEFVNRGDAPVRFDEATLRGDPEFTLLPGISLPAQLLPGDSIRFPILYVPGPLGSRQTMLHMKGEGQDFDSLDAPVRVQNDLLRLTIDRDSLDLGNRACDSGTKGTISIINEGNVATQGVRLELLPGSRARLSVDVPEQFMAGDTVRAVLTPPDSLYGQLFDTLRIVVPECGLEYLIPITGRCAVGTIEIAWGEEEGEIGQTIGLPLSVTANPPNFARQAPVYIRVVGRMVNDVLLPNGILSETPDGLTARLLRQYIRGDDRLVELELTGTLPANGLLTTMEAIALLGSDSLSDVAIDTLDFRFLSDVFDGTVSSEDGSFRTLGLCYVGSARLVDATGTFALRTVPNPSQNHTEILLDLIEDGPTSLLLINEAGEEVMTLIEGEMGAGAWRITTSLEGIPSGLYRLHLVTRTQSLSAPLRVLR